MLDVAVDVLVVPVAVVTVAALVVVGAAVIPSVLSVRVTNGGVSDSEVTVKVVVAISWEGGVRGICFPEEIGVLGKFITRTLGH